MKRSSSSTLCLLILALLFGKSAIVAHDTTAAAEAAEAAADTVAAAVDKEEDSSSSLLLLDNDDNKNEIAILPSPDLTAEELELLAEMNLNLNDDDDDDDDDDNDAKEKEGVGRETRNTNLLYKTLYDLLDKTKKELAQWKTIQQESIPKLMERHEALTKRYEEVQRDTVQLLDLIRQWNQNEIRSFTSRIQNVIQEELHRREKLPELELQFKEKMMRRNNNNNNDDAAADDDDDDNALWGALTMDHVYEIFNVPEMNRWISKELGSDALQELNEKMKYALVEYLQECENVLGRKKMALEQDILQAKEERHQANQCVKMVDAAHQILSSLKQLDKDEKQTDALVDAKVVYGEKWTSDTYHQHQQRQQQQHELEQVLNDEIGLKLGDLHVRKYFPQDWERLLPSGWEDWDISLWQKIHSLPSLDNILPAYFWHSIPRQLTSIVESPFGKVIPAPVETVLDPNGNLGSCWKMTGRNGRVTFRLKRPVVVESITIDHYPWLSSAHNPDDFRNHVTSAPRFMRVIGYPPCDDDNVECQEQIGFDAERSIYMNSFEYKVDASRWNDGDLDEGNVPINSSQTFQLSSVNVLPEDDDDDNDADYEDDAEEKIPTCDAVKATSCHGKVKQTIDDSQKLLAALTLTIDVNWGNPNYTCLYRVRVNERKWV